MKPIRIISACIRKKIIAHLKRGGLIAYPTESCYGIGCLPHHTRALKKLIHLKKRPQSKGMIVIGGKLAQLLPLLGKLPEKTVATLTHEWPAATTLLLPCRQLLPLLRGTGHNKLAVRIPSHHPARLLCNILGTPLVSTSCNRSGRYPCKNAREACRQFGRNVWVLKGRVGLYKTPSRIIDTTTGKQLR